MLKRDKNSSNSSIVRNLTFNPKHKPSVGAVKTFLVSSLSTLGLFLSIGDYTHVDYLIDAVNYVITNHPDCLPKDNPFGFYSVKELFQNPNLMADAIKNRSSLPIIKEVADNLNPIVENLDLIIEESKSHNDVIPRNSFSVMSEAVRDPSFIGDLNRIYDNVAPRNNLPIKRELIQASDSNIRVSNTTFKIKRLAFDIKATSPNIQALDSSIKASRSAIQFPAPNIQDPEPTSDDKYRTTVRIVSFIVGSICTAAV